MIQAATIPLERSARAPAPPRVWGHDAVALHDAYWAARGVQCVRLGTPVPLQRAAEFYLLLGAEQLVLFTLRGLTERLTWHNARVTRIRLAVDEGENYSERVVLDETACVQRIERQYRARSRGSTRVILVTRRRHAEQWMQSTSAREAWRQIRRGASRAERDHARLGGQVFRANDSRSERQMVTALVERWERPDQIIDGIAEIEDRVWARTDTAPPEDLVRIGPLWLGDDVRAERCLVGPAWVTDGTDLPALRIREISEVEAVHPIRSATAHRATRPAYTVTKRIFDMAFSFTVLLVFSPMLLVIALLILLEDGRPIFFGHRRQARGGRTFRCWKFRTMHRNAEQIARELAQYNVCDGPQVYIQNDPRVTRIGRVLRDLHLDEIPQFWNVLCGQMSVVGPRPSPDNENQYCPAWRELRLSVRPGITGLWQLKRTRQPGEDFQEWIRYDIAYVRRANLRMDLSILYRTVKMVLSGRSDRETQ